jgi:GNAT superfamily N-acetyltransferase
MSKGEVEVRRARIEEIRPLAEEYHREQSSVFGAPTDAPLPHGGIFWLATDGGTGDLLGYAAGTLRPAGCTIGPVFTRTSARRRGVGGSLLMTIQQWARDTRVPVVEISVNAENPNGQAFLESLGYRPRRVLMTLSPVQAPPASAAAGAATADVEPVGVEPAGVDPADPDPT